MRAINAKLRELHPHMLKRSFFDLAHTLTTDAEDARHDVQGDVFLVGYLQCARRRHLVEPWGSILVEGLFLHEPDLAIPVNVEKEVVTTRHVRARSILWVGAVGTGEMEVTGK